MIINVWNRPLNIDDKMAEVIQKNYMEIDEDFCLHYIEVFFTDETKVPYKRADLNEIFATKTDKELSDAVNSLLKNTMKFIRGGEDV